MIRLSRAGLTFCLLILCGRLLPLSYELNLAPGFGKHFANDFNTAWSNYTQSALVAGSAISYQSLTYISYSFNGAFDISVSPLLGHFIGVGAIFSTSNGSAKMYGTFSNNITYKNELSYYTLAPMIHYRYYPYAKQKQFSFYLGVDLGYSVLSSYTLEMSSGTTVNQSITYDRPRGFLTGARVGYKFIDWGSFKVFTELSYTGFILNDFSGGQHSSSADEYTLKINDNVNDKTVMASIKDGDTNFGASYTEAEDFINMIRLSIGLSYVIP